MRGFPGGEEVLERRTEGAGGRPGGVRFAVLEPVEAPGPLLAGPVRDAEADREQPQIADREPLDLHQPAHYAVVARGLLAEHARGVAGRRFRCRSRYPGLIDEHERSLVARRGGGRRLPWRSLFPVHAFCSCTVAVYDQGFNVASGPPPSSRLLARRRGWKAPL